MKGSGIHARNEIRSFLKFRFCDFITYFPLRIIFDLLYRFWVKIELYDQIFSRLLGSRTQSDSVRVKKFTNSILSEIEIFDLIRHFWVKIYSYFNLLSRNRNVFWVIRIFEPIFENIRSTLLFSRRIQETWLNRIFLSRNSVIRFSFLANYLIRTINKDILILE